MHIVNSPEPGGHEPDQSPTPHLRCVESPANNSDGDHAAAEPVTARRYKTDVTALTQRIAIQLAEEGVANPVAAALMLAVRGLTRLDAATLAHTLGLTELSLAELERGTVALNKLPQSVWTTADEYGVEPLVLIDLETSLR